MNKELIEQLSQLQETITASIHKMNDTLMDVIVNKREEVVSAVSDYIAAVEEAKDFTCKIAEVGNKISSLGNIYGDMYAEQDDIAYICEDLLGAVDDYESPDDEDEDEDGDGEEEDE